MFSIVNETGDTQVAIERFVMAAIVDARRGSTDQRWLSWADAWISGRDRSFSSAHTAHCLARQACAHELSFGPQCPDADAADTPAQRAFWAAGLALLTAPVGPDPGAAVRRVVFAAWSWLSGTRTVLAAKPVGHSLRDRLVAIARRAALMVLPSELPQTVRSQPQS